MLGRHTQPQAMSSIPITLIARVMNELSMPNASALCKIYKRRRVGQLRNASGQESLPGIDMSDFVYEVTLPSRLPSSESAQSRIAIRRLIVRTQKLHHRLTGLCVFRNDLECHEHGRRQDNPRDSPIQAAKP